MVELRQYTLHPGKRDELIDLFDRELVESQERLGIHVIGQFRDIDRPDGFVWLRGFADFSVRAGALRAFYGGPVWAAHRSQANATMVDASNVLLLRPSRHDGGFVPRERVCAHAGASTPVGSLLVATIYALDAPASEDFTEAFESEVAPEMSNAGSHVAAAFVTESRANAFPILPVREGENVFAWFATFASAAAYRNHLVRLEGSRHWRETVSKSLRSKLKSDPEILRLAPTPRSRLRG